MGWPESLLASLTGYRQLLEGRLPAGLYLREVARERGCGHLSTLECKGSGGSWFSWPEENIFTTEDLERSIERLQKSLPLLQAILFLPPPPPPALHVFHVFLLVILLLVLLIGPLLLVLLLNNPQPHHLTGFARII